MRVRLDLSSEILNPSFVYSYKTKPLKMSILPTAIPDVEISMVQFLADRTV